MGKIKTQFEYKGFKVRGIEDDNGNLEWVILNADGKKVAEPLASLGECKELILSGQLRKDYVQPFVKKEKIKKLQVALIAALLISHIFIGALGFKVYKIQTELSNLKHSHASTQAMQEALIQHVQLHDGEFEHLESNLMYLFEMHTDNYLKIEYLFEIIGIENIDGYEEE